MAKWNIPQSTANTLRPVDLFVKVPAIGRSGLALPIINYRPQLRVRN